MQRIFLCALALALGIGPTVAQEQLKVVATFSILADLARNVGGDRVAVTSLVAANGDAHVYAASPADAKTLAAANVVIVNGLGFEGWMERLVKASGTKAPMVVASKGVKPLKGEDSHTDPHAWQSVANTKIYVANIRDGLVAADPDGAQTYNDNARAYLAKLDALEIEVRAAMDKIPPERRKIITTHDAFGYFAAAYGMQFIAPQGVATDAEASAKDVGRIITQIKAQKVPAVFLENVTDPRLIKRISEETSARIGGTVFSDALSDAKGPAPTYIDMMQNNIRQFSAALAS